MSSILGRELRKFPLYKTDLFDRKGDVYIMEGGIIFESNNHKTDIPKEMIEDIKIIRELPFAKYLVNMQYTNYMGMRENVSMIVAKEDYNYLVSKLK